MNIKHIKNLINLVVFALAVFIIGYSLIILIGGAINRGEAYECHKWAEQANAYEGFYYTEWQKAQCGLSGSNTTGEYDR
jgi:hypothetical protein